MRNNELAVKDGGRLCPGRRVEEGMSSRRHLNPTSFYTCGARETIDDLNDPSMSTNHVGARLGDARPGANRAEKPPFTNEFGRAGGSN